MRLYHTWDSNPTFHVNMTVSPSDTLKEIRLFDFCYPKYIGKIIYLPAIYKPSDENGWKKLYVEFHHAFKDEGASVFCRVVQPSGSDRRVHTRYVIQCFRSRIYQGRKNFLKNPQDISDSICIEVDRKDNKKKGIISPSNHSKKGLKKTTTSRPLINQ